MGVCQSIDEVHPIRNDGNDNKKMKNLDDDVSDSSTADEYDEQNGTAFRSIKQSGREEVWLSETGGHQLNQKSDISDTLCPSCGAPVLTQSLRPLHSEGEDHLEANPLIAHSTSAPHERGVHFVCGTCWDNYKKMMMAAVASSPSGLSVSRQHHCIFCLVGPVLQAINKYGFCDVTFARWLQVVAHCTGRKNRLVCAAAIIANSGEPAALASFSAAPKETAAAMIISISCILEDRYPPKRFQTSCSSSFSSHTHRRPTTPFSRQLVAPKVVQLWIAARESLMSSIFGMPEKILNPALTRLYIRAGLSYRAFTLAGHPFTNNSLQKNVLQQIVVCAAAAEITTLDDSHHSVDSVKRSAPGLNHDILAEYPPFMFQ